jgi:type VII secretion-associated serine protease mycosin
VAASGRAAKIVAAAGREPTKAPEPHRIKRNAPAKSTSDPTTTLVRFDPGISRSAQRDAARDAGVDIVGEIPELHTVLVALGDHSRSDVAERMASDGRVAAVEANRIRHAMGDASDELYPYQLNLFTSRLPAAWDVTHGSPTLDIAILDTGVTLSHPDLVSRIGAKTDFVNGDAVPEDVDGHGTMVAGIAAAQADNAIGIAGAAWNARIMPVKVLGDDGSGTDSDIAQGIVWATDHGAEVINLSLGAPETSDLLGGAVAYATSRGVVVVASAGNDGNGTKNYPAAYPDVIAVGATDPYGDVASFSATGPWVDVVASGIEVTSTACCAGGYATGDGTSFSAPLVSGIAALVRTKFPSSTPAQVQTWLRATAIDRGPAGFDDYYGAGLVDAYASVGGRTAASPPPAARDAFEPDDVPARARPIVTDQQRTLAPEGDVDWNYVDAPGDGALTVSIGALDIPSRVSAWSSLLGSLPSLDLAPGLPDHVKVHVANGERYYFRVDATRTATDDPTHAPRYTMSSTFVPEVGSVTPGEQGWITSVTPPDFAAGVASSFHPTVTFARALDASSIGAATVRMIDGKTGAAISATRTYDAATRVVTVTPSARLPNGRAVVLQVSGVRDGSAFVMNDPYVSRFTVATSPTRDLDADFNKDGYEDVVVAAPTEDAGSHKDTGVVHVLYGSQTGAKGAGSQMWSQDSSGVPDKAEAGDKFGAAVATGDLNNDGYDDLVIGVPGEDVGTVKDAGAVHVLLGAASGLSGPGQLWTENSKGVPGASETSDRFGASLAVGTFDGPAGADVAIGSPTETVGSSVSAGAVHILRGASAGLTGTGSQQWTQDSAGIRFFAEAGDAFGAALAAGDFEGDGNDDLAIGAPSDDIDAGDEGTVTLMRGSITGVHPSGLLADFFSGSDEPESGDRFGAALAIGDFGGLAASDAYDELAIGIPGEDGPSNNMGLVDILWSDHSGPGLAFVSLNQSSTLLSGVEDGAALGSALALRHSPSGRGVIAIGVPFDDVQSVSQSGAVAVIEAQTASTDGFAGFVPSSALGTRRAHLTEDSPGAPEDAESGDHYGWSVSLADVDGDGDADLVAGAPDEGVGSSAASGAVYVVRDPLATTPDYQMFTQDTAGVGSAVEPGDRFGWSLG